MRKLALIIAVTLWCGQATAQTAIPDSVKIERHYFNVVFDLITASGTSAGFYCQAGTWASWPDVKSAALGYRVDWFDYTIKDAAGNFAGHGQGDITLDSGGAAGSYASLRGLGVPEGHRAFAPSTGATNPVWRPDLCAQNASAQLESFNSFQGELYAHFNMPADDPVALFEWKQLGATDPPFVSRRSAVSFDGSFESGLSREPEPGGSKAVVSYAWDFGDGNMGAGPIVSHTYTDVGTYSVKLTVTDDDGQTAEITHAIKVTAAILEYRLREDLVSVSLDDTVAVRVVVNNVGVGVAKNVKVPRKIGFLHIPSSVTQKATLGEALLTTDTLTVDIGPGDSVVVEQKFLVTQTAKNTVNSVLQDVTIQMEPFVTGVSGEDEAGGDAEIKNTCEPPDCSNTFDVEPPKPFSFTVAVSDTLSDAAFDATEPPTVTVGEEVFLLVRVINTGAEELKDILVANLSIFPDTVQALNFLRAEPLQVDNLAPNDTSRIVFVYEALTDVDITITVLAMQATFGTGPDMGQITTVENTTCSVQGKRADFFAVTGGCGQISVEPIALIVNSTTNGNDASPGDEQCDTGEVVTIDNEDQPECTLRAAIQEAAASTAGKLQTIKFEIPDGDGAHRIDMAGPALPAITTSILIKGDSQPDGTLIEVDGTGYAGTATSVAFNLGNGSSGIAEVTDLAFYGFPTSVLGMRAGVNGVFGNRFGTDWAGKHATGSAQEIAALRNAGNAILVTGDAAHIGNHPLGGGGNLIVGSLNGIYVESATGVEIGNNVIGSVTSPNSENAILLNDAPDATIGGDAGSNTIVHNLGHGILVSGTKTAPIWIQDNAIEENGMDGINIQQDVNPELRQVIGGTVAQGNAILKNEGAGIRVLGNGDATVDPVERARIQSNVLEDNKERGIVVVNGSRVKIGGLAAEPGDEPGNRIMNGVSFEPGYASWIEGNVISNIDATTGFSAAQDAVYIRGNNNIVGGDNPEKGNHIMGLPEPEEDPMGLGIVNEGIDTVIELNLVGTDGTVATPLETGILLNNAATVRDNVISGNSYAGIVMSFGSGLEASVVGNYIGTDVDGEVAIPNEGPGIEVTEGAPTIGGLREMEGSCEDPCNLISGNGGPGILIGKTAGGTTVEGNFVGVNVSGTKALGNEESGVVVLADNVTIGGLSSVASPLQKCTGACNLIAANGKDGIRAFKEDELISLNNPNGEPSAGDEGASGLTVTGNIVGVALAGGDGYTGGNKMHGVALGGGGDENVVGGSGNDEGNLISWNGRSGIAVYASSDDPVFGNSDGKRNVLSGNAFVQNKGIAIDLDTDHLLNNKSGWNILDAGDDDDGSNTLINWPYLVESRGVELTDLLVLWTGPIGEYTLELYKNSNCRGGSMEAMSLHESRLVFFRGDDVDTVRVNDIRTSSYQPFLSATIRDSDGNTSEVSNCLPRGRRVRKAVTNLDVDVATSVTDALVTLRQNNATQLSKSAARSSLSAFVLQADEPLFGTPFEDSTAIAPTGNPITPRSTRGQGWELIALDPYVDLAYDLCLPNASLGIDADRAVVVASGPATNGAWHGFDTRIENIDGVDYSCAEGLSFVGSYALAVEDALALAAPSLLAPSDSSTGVAPSPILAWTPSANAQTYDVQVTLGTDPLFVAPVQDLVGLKAPVVVVEDLDPLTTYLWRVRIVGTSDTGPWSTVFSFSTGTVVDIAGIDEDGALPTEFQMSAPYPNPFDHATTIDVDLEAASQLNLAVFDALGRRVLDLFAGRLPAGRHRVSFRANGLPSGVYYIHLRSETGLRETRAVTLLR